MTVKFGAYLGAWLIIWTATRLVYFFSFIVRQSLETNSDNHEWELFLRQKGNYKDTKPRFCHENAVTLKQNKQRNLIKLSFWSSISLVNKKTWKTWKQSRSQHILSVQWHGSSITDH